MGTVIFVLSKIVWACLTPGAWLFLAAAAAGLQWRRRRYGQVRLIAMLASGFVIALTLLPVGDALIRPLEAAYPAPPDLPAVNGIIVLGGGQDLELSAAFGDAEFTDASERVLTAFLMARKYPDARIVLTGGSGALFASGPLTEAELTARLLIDMGIAPDRIVTETRSRNTSENAGFSLPLAAPAPGETWVLVTSAFHMPRAMESFRRAGWPDLTAFPVDHRAPPNWARLTWDFTGNLGKTEIAIKEYVGLLAYGILGR